MSTDKCKSIDDKHRQDQKEEEKHYEHFLDQAKEEAINYFNQWNEGEIHLEKMKKKVEGEG